MTVEVTESLEVLALSSYGDASAGWVQMAACLSIGTGAAYLGDAAVLALVSLMLLAWYASLRSLVANAPPWFALLPSR